MPACKDITDPDGVGSGKVRCGLVDISAAGLKFQVGIGGVADADFMEYEQIAAENLPVSQKVHLKWEDAVFYGRHWLLGPVIAHLDMERHPAVTQRSFVLSVAENSAGYFPAFNENHFIFNFFLPRFNLRFKSDEEIINSATIFSIPPVNSIYELKNMVTYKVDRGNSGFWKFIIPKFKIEKCNIKLLEIKNIQLTYNVISETDNDVSFDFTAVNNTSNLKLR